MRTNQKKEEELPAAELEASTTVKDAYMLYVVDIYICVVFIIDLEREKRRKG